MAMLTKEQFKKLYDKCMKQKKIYFDDGSSRPAKPKCIIRDFDIDVSDMQQSGVWNNDDDRAFTNFEKAWDYFKTLRRARVMDVAGQIYYDYYAEMEKQRAKPNVKVGDMVGNTVQGFNFKVIDIKSGLYGLVVKNMDTGEIHSTNKDNMYKPKKPHYQDIHKELGVPDNIQMYEVKSVKEMTGEIRSIIDHYEQQGIHTLGAIPEGNDKKRLRELFKALGQDVRF